MNLTVSTQLSEGLIYQWDAFIDANPHGNVLQSRIMFELFKGTLNFEPLFIYCTDRGELVGTLLAVSIREGKGIKGLFSTRVVIYGGPIVKPHHPQTNEIIRILLDKLVSLTRKKAIFTQFRASYDLNEWIDCFTDFGFRWYPRLNLIINTSDEVSVFSGFSASRRRQVRKSLNNGAKIIEPDSLEQIHLFYNILRRLYKERVKKPIPDITFFERFYFEVLPKNKGKIFLIHYQNKIIGGILCPYLIDKSMFEWYVCGLDHDFKEKGIYPSVLATWAAIDFATRNHCANFDFMGLGMPDKEYGVRNFKLKFGGNVVNYGRLIRINRPVLYGIAELGFNVLSSLKKI